MDTEAPTLVPSNVARHLGHITTTMLVNEIPSLTYRKLDYWTRAGYVYPNEEATGSGYARTWPPEEVAVIKLICRYLDVGFLLGVALALARKGFGCHEIAPGVFLEIEPTELPGDDIAADALMEASYEHSEDLRLEAMEE